MTYTTHTTKFGTSVFRTLESKQRASLRAMKREPTFDMTRPIISAQDKADEKWLSRSKVYPDKANRR